MTAEQRPATSVAEDAHATAAQLLGSVAVDYAAAQHPDARRAWDELSVEAHASREATEARAEIRGDRW
ncbi:hypothetical protein ABZ883_04840 [Streptomyces sp. NPDC046977]|uniref:hypothetical protein n=1 Tax=Streptomyces sp. NPDC046977 TaxID=3154703 RepID=UPI0033D876E0